MQQLNCFHKIFYFEKRKAIPFDFKNVFTSKWSLLIWYLDDGNLRTDCNAFRFSTDSFTKKEVLPLIEILKENFGIQAQINKTGKKEKDCYTIYIGAKDGMATHFNNMFKPFVARKIPSMLYKFF